MTETLKNILLWKMKLSKELEVISSLMRNSQASVAEVPRAKTNASTKVSRATSHFEHTKPFCLPILPFPQDLVILLLANKTPPWVYAIMHKHRHIRVFYMTVNIK